MNIGNAETWGNFGLAGMVIFALFILVSFLIAENRRSQNQFIDCMRELTKITDERQQETNKTINALAMIIDRFNTRHG